MANVKLCPCTKEQASPGKRCCLAAADGTAQSINPPRTQEQDDLLGQENEAGVVQGDNGVEMLTGCCLKASTTRTVVYGRYSL